MVKKEIMKAKYEKKTFALYIYYVQKRFTDKKGK